MRSISRESPRARMAIEPKAVAHLLLDHGIEPILQMTARDRNRIALQADLLGAAVLGIENVVFMSGDSPTGGDHPEAKPVFDLFATEMLNMARALVSGSDMAGNALKGAPKLYLRAVTNPGLRNSHAKWKTRVARSMQARNSCRRKRSTKLHHWHDSSTH
mgnify:CR=1 FL=1